jgi:hypothetical protein
MTSKGLPATTALPAGSGAIAKVNGRRPNQDARVVAIWLPGGRAIEPENTRLFATNPIASREA